MSRVVKIATLQGLEGENGGTYLGSRIDLVDKRSERSSATHPDPKTLELNQNCKKLWQLGFSESA